MELAQAKTHSCCRIIIHFNTFSVVLTFMAKCLFVVQLLGQTIDLFVVYKFFGGVLCSFLVQMFFSSLIVSSVMQKLLIHQSVGSFQQF
mmetsp:Transcript_19975/g.29406  ORF Transcript_19975/g.29406 Transcript_19975/m.29406 type:complete len:89 (-) Transcript_19975:15-281(-)